MDLLGFYLVKALNSRVLCVFGNVVLLFLKYELKNVQILYSNSYK